MLNKSPHSKRTAGTKHSNSKSVAESSSSEEDSSEEEVAPRQLRSSGSAPNLTFSVPKRVPKREKSLLGSVVALKRKLRPSTRAVSIAVAREQLMLAKQRSTITTSPNPRGSSCSSPSMSAKSKNSLSVEKVHDAKTDNVAQSKSTKQVGSVKSNDRLPSEPTTSRSSEKKKPISDSNASKDVKTRNPRLKKALSFSKSDDRKQMRTSPLSSPPLVKTVSCGGSSTKSATNSESFFSSNCPVRHMSVSTADPSSVVALDCKTVLSSPSALRVNTTG